MKNSPTAQPRFICRIVRGCVAIFGDTATGEPRGLGASHVAACEDCQQFFRACDELAFALKRDAVREWQEAPAGLEQKILRGVTLSTRASAPAASTSRGAWMSLGGVAACAVLAAVVYQRQMSPGISSPAIRANVAANPIDPTTLAAAREVIAAVPVDLFDRVQPQAQAFLQQDPLQNEVDAVVSDARTAFRFLARNFLPVPVEQPASGE